MYRRLLLKNKLMKHSSFFTSRRNLEEGSKEWFEKVKEARSTMSRAEIREGPYQSPQWYYTTTDDNYQKTTASFVHEELAKDNVYLMGLTEFGFRFRDTTVAIGPIVAFPKLTVSWRVASVDDITEESLILFTLLEPKLEVLLIGVGDYRNVEKVRKRLNQFCLKNRLRVEILSTEDACAAFNYLNSDGRAVGACLYPPDIIQEPSRQESIAFGAIHEEFFHFPEPADMFGMPKTVKGESLVETTINYFSEKNKKLMEKREKTRKELEKLGQDKPRSRNDDL